MDDAPELLAVSAFRNRRYRLSDSALNDASTTAHSGSFSSPSTPLPPKLEATYSSPEFTPSNRPLLVEHSYQNVIKLLKTRLVDEQSNWAQVYIFKDPIYNLRFKIGMTSHLPNRLKDIQRLCGRQLQPIFVSATMSWNLAQRVERLAQCELRAFLDLEYHCKGHKKTVKHREYFMSVASDVIEEIIERWSSFLLQLKPYDTNHRFRKDMAVKLISHMTENRPQEEFDDHQRRSIWWQTAIQSLHALVNTDSLEKCREEGRIEYANRREKMMEMMEDFEKKAFETKGRKSTGLAHQEKHMEPDQNAQQEEAEEETLDLLGDDTSGKSNQGNKNDQDERENEEDDKEDGQDEDDNQDKKDILDKEDFSKEDEDFEDESRSEVATPSRRPNRNSILRKSDRLEEQQKDLGSWISGVDNSNCPSEELSDNDELESCGVALSEIDYQIFLYGEFSEREGTHDRNFSDGETGNEEEKLEYTESEDDINSNHSVASSSELEYYLFLNGEFSELEHLSDPDYTPEELPDDEELEYTEDGESSDYGCLDTSGTKFGRIAPPIPYENLYIMFILVSMSSLYHSPFWTISVWATFLVLQAFRDFVTSTSVYKETGV